ncbi:MAG: acetate/propionate family kinase [Pseudomonadota bacterium]
MKKSLLVINAGSSSIRFAQFELAAGALPVRGMQGHIDGLGRTPQLVVHDRLGGCVAQRALDPGGDPAADHASALVALFDCIAGPDWPDGPHAVAHRIVHGGPAFVRPVRVTSDVLVQLQELVPLAPLHQPLGLAALRAAAARWPGVPQIACFDTAFHATRSPVEQAFALPQPLRDAGIRRYGFHGLSYEYIAGVLPLHLGALAGGRIVVAHLGNGASLCAMRGRKSVATTMGMTPLDGLMMGTRCGRIDPGAVLHLIRGLGMTPDEVETLLYRHSGLLGTSGISGDMRVLEASSEPAAGFAIDLYVHAITRELGAMVALLGGLDALVFTAGIGEHSARIRERVCRDAAWLGVELSAGANDAGETRISTPRSRASAWVIPTHEARVIAHQAGALLAI